VSRREGSARSPAHPLGTASSRYEILAIAIAVGSMGTLGFSITAPLLPDLADAFGVSRGAIGLVQAAVSVPGVLFSAIIGYLADRLGRRRVVLVSLLIFSTFGLAGFVARSFWGLIAVRFLQGVGTSGILGLGIVLVGDRFSGPERTKAMGINLTGLTVVNILGPMASGLLATGGTFRPFLIFIIGYPLALWASRIPRDKPQRAAESPLRHARDAVATMRRNRTLTDFAGVLVTTIGAVIVLHGLGLTTTPLFLDEEFGAGVALRGAVVATFQVGTIVTAIRIGWFRDRYGASRVLTVGFGLMALGAAFAGAAPGVWAVAGGLMVSGIGFGLFTPLAQEFAARVGTGVYRGVTVLTWVTVVRFGQLIGPPFGSFLTDSAGPRVTFAVAAAGMALLTVSWGPLRRRTHRTA
jgi:MFS family permease